MLLLNMAILGAQYNQPTLARFAWSIKASDPGELVGVMFVIELVFSRPRGLS